MAAVIERAELHKTIWRIANDLRGSVDGWDFKSYVLGFLFYRFISENLTDYVNASERAAILAEGGTPEEAAAFDYATLSDADAEVVRDSIVKEKGFFIRPGGVWVFRTVCFERVVLSSPGCLWPGRMDDHEEVLEAHA